KSARSVRYAEAKPPELFFGLVHSYWELKTEVALEDDFCLHAIPDACVNILFNQVQTEIAGVTALRTRFEVLNLGKSFHYVGIQLLPGVWQGSQQEIAGQFVGSPYLGELPLVATSQELVKRDFPAKQEVLSSLVQKLIDTNLVVNNFVMARILANIARIHTVSDMASVACLSPRQLQRTLKQTTGFAPHDLLKVLRIQQSFRQHYLDLYADQSHYIHSFRKVTGYTPAKYIDKFDV
ncbi:MAG: AraC family transcriptional regulator, partial [Hydrogenophaga sp.]|nr:AraC family transcriptional regulator [Hydrogenophaga sp.]